MKTSRLAAGRPRLGGGRPPSGLAGVPRARPPGGLPITLGSSVRGSLPGEGLKLPPLRTKVRRTPLYRETRQLFCPPIASAASAWAPALPAAAGQGQRARFVKRSPAGPEH